MSTPADRGTEFYWHVHHETLVEPLTEPIENRVAYIKATKPKSEQATRLRLMRPADLSSLAASDKARAAYDKARAAYGKAWAAAQPAIEALHREQCVTDCPWNGRTIFP